MRELEFRVWSDYWKKYATEAELYMDGLGDAVFETEDGIPHHENTDLIIELSTGLKDKNGKKIWEGDIVKLTGKVAKNKSTLYKVVWDNFLTGFDLISLERSKEDIGYLNEVEMEERYKVIGNIHENKELLEEKKEC